MLALMCLNSEKVVVVWKKWLYTDKSGCIRVKVVVFGQKLCFRTKVVVFGQGGCLRAKLVAFGPKWL